MTSTCIAREKMVLRSAGFTYQCNGRETFMTVGNEALELHIKLYYIIFSTWYMVCNMQRVFSI